MRTELNALLTLKILRQREIAKNAEVLDILEIDGPVVKNVCAKVSTALADEIDRVCSYLDISKRRFLEAAIIEAVRQADEAIESEELDLFLKLHEGSEGGAA